MVILIGNQKGGAGKSTLTLLLANYLTSVHEKKVTVLDMDYQQSISSKYEKAKILENEEPYEIVSVDLDQFPVLLKVLTKNSDETLLVDLPGKMDDDALIPVIRSGNLILCPFSYDEFSVDSTLLFAMVTTKINKKAPLVFVPNRLKPNVRYDTRTEVDKVLAKFGPITPGIADRIDFQRVTTLYTPAIVLPAILPILQLIYDNYINKEDSK